MKYRVRRVALASVVIISNISILKHISLFRGAMEPPSEDEAMEGQHGTVLHTLRAGVDGNGEEAFPSS